MPRPRPLFVDGWRFPLPRPHAGIAMANGILGLMAWGDQTLKLSIGRAGFWDHRGGNAFSARLNFADLRALLDNGRETELREAFRSTGASVEPTQLPCGVLELTFATPPSRAAIDSESGTLDVWLEHAATPIRITIADDAELVLIGLPDSAAQVQIAFTPAFVSCGTMMSDRGIRAPVIQQKLGQNGECVGEVIHQELPSDPSLTCTWSFHENTIKVRTWMGDAAPGETAVSVQDALHTKRNSFWEQFWGDVPRVELPQSHLTRLYDYGLLKFGGLTHPAGVAATLQGAWMEAYQLPPWSNDYHFNINLQMCYWPALSCNRTTHMEPLWRMIRSWFPKLRDVGEQFFGATNAMMLPHAVDDQCQAIGTFWQGTVDHASTAWIAQLAWLDYRYSLNETHLRDTAWPLLNGAFNGFWAMLEDRDGALRLPISVSPEYGEGAIGTWGANASFQLAALHGIARILPKAAALLQQPIDLRWGDVSKRLPAYSLVPIAPEPWDRPGQRRHRIGLWEGQDLGHSHRHHSHLAAVYPFETIDPQDPAHADHVNETIEHWTKQGAGEWSAWCLPWAAIICARTGRADASLAWLQWFTDNCANEGDNLSPSGLQGCMTHWRGWDDARRKPDEHFEIMQLDAHMGFITAINELIAHTVNDEIRVLPRVPFRWKDFTFERVGVEGGFVLSGVVERHRIVTLSVTSRHGGILRLRHGIEGRWTVDRRVMSGQLLVCNTEAGQTLSLGRE